MPRTMCVEMKFQTDGKKAEFIFEPNNPSFHIDGRITDAAQELYQTNASIHHYLTLIDAMEVYEIYVQQIYRSAQAYFDSDYEDMSLGAFLLKQCQDEFVASLGHRVREKFLSSLSFWVVVVSVPVSIVGFLSTILYDITNHVMQLLFYGRYPDDVAHWISHYGAIIVGACIGIWISSVLRNRTLTWSSIRIFDPDGFSPILRISLVLGLTLMLCMLINS